MNAPDLYSLLPREANEYLRRLRAGLAPLPDAEREEIVRETAAHMIDRAEAAAEGGRTAGGNTPPGGGVGGSPAGDTAPTSAGVAVDAERIGAVLAELGEPETYAGRFVANYRISSALASGSPLALAATVLRLTGRGILAFCGGMVVFVLYAFAVGFLVVGAAKPILPRQTGLFVGPGNHPFALGVIDSASTAAAREVLGYWLVPLAFGAGLLLLLATNRIARAYLRSLRR